jgi:hypothetical protein
MDGGEEKMKNSTRKRKAGGPLTDNQVAVANRLFYYEPETGKILRRETIIRSNGAPTHYVAGDIAGGVGSNGYRHVCFVAGDTEVVILAHRLAFYLLGQVPPSEIDHINGLRDDNRWANLRATTRSNNQLNRHVKVGKSSDLPIGVYRAKRKGRPGIWYAVRVGRLGQDRSTYKRNLDDAIAWRATALQSMRENAA